MSDHAKPKSGFLLGNQSYDVARNVVQYWIPGLGTFYFTLATIWDLPYGEQVVGTLAALGILLGIILGISKKTYNNTDLAYDGALVVDDENDIIRLDVQTPLFDMGKKKVITLRVDPRPGELVSLNQEPSQE